MAFAIGRHVFHCEVEHNSPSNQRSLFIYATQLFYTYETNIWTYTIDFYDCQEDGHSTYSKEEASEYIDSVD